MTEELLFELVTTKGKQLGISVFRVLKMHTQELYEVHIGKTGSCFTIGFITNINDVREYIYQGGVNGFKAITMQEAFTYFTININIGNTEGEHLNLSFKDGDLVILHKQGDKHNSQIVVPKSVINPFLIFIQQNK